MNELNTTLLGQTMPTHTLLMALGIVASFLWTAREHRQIIRAQIIDSAIGGLIGAFITARLFYVWLNWGYFVDHQAQIFTLPQSGLDWRGAVIGALLAMWVMARLRRVEYLPLLESTAFVLPLIGYLSWRACQINRCAYGAEVSNLSDYPPLIVAELPDIFGLIVPRFNTQLIGMSLSLLVLGVVIVLRYKGWLTGHHFAISLLLYSVSMLLIGFLRGDVLAMDATLRLDQWLDSTLIVISIGLIAGKLLVRSRHRTNVGQT